MIEKASDINAAGFGLRASNKLDHHLSSALRSCVLGLDPSIQAA